MKTPIRPDVHARFMTLVARAEARLRLEEQAVRKRSAGLLARERRAEASAASRTADEE